MQSGVCAIRRELGGFLKLWAASDHIISGRTAFHRRFDGGLRCVPDEKRFGGQGREETVCRGSPIGISGAHDGYR